MKKIMMLCALIGLTQMATAQKSSYDPMARPNIVKLNLSGLAYKNIAVQYERILGNKISVACQLRFTPKGSMMFSKALDQVIDSDSVQSSDIKSGGFAITPEFRFYPRHAGKGFYLAPYLRYRNVNFDAPVSYLDDNGKTQYVTSEGNFNSFIGGLMIGSQFNLGKMVTLDWFILGLQYGSTKVDLKVKNTEPLSANDQADIKSSVEDFTDYFGNLNTVVGPNGGSVTGTLAMLGFRGFGINIGFKF